jgi:hypothetical protein
MFYQNSNDLVKKASVNSGHIQNSYATQQQIIHQGVQKVDRDGDTGDTGATGATGATGFASLNIGAQFQNALNSIIGSFSAIEGLENPPSVATPGTGPVGVGGNQTQVLNDLVQQNADYVAQEEKHRNRVNAVISLVDADNNNSRGTWTQVTDTAGVSKYGYLTKDRIFQIWLAPSDPTNNPQNWFETSPVKQNGGVLGCPVTGGNLTKHQIDTTWDAIKPFDMVYAKGDTSRKTPLFMLTNDGVRDVKRSPGSSGLFSCGNERTNVFVKDRPSADFDTSIKTNRQGCYIVDDKATDRTFKDRGFVFQEDMANASISQCKRRAEDLGSSYFLISAPESSGPENRGGCWIYTGTGEPNLNGLLSYDESGKKCYNHGQPDGNEDGFMKSYGTTILPRLYGKSNTIDVSTGPPDPSCDHTNTDRCIFTDYKRNGSGDCYHKDSASWGYSGRGLARYGNNELKDWLGSLESRNGGGFERAAVQEYRERCKTTKGYEFLDDNQVKRTKEQKSVALYSLKVGGPTGVDATDRNGRGVVGRIAYIDHNGERHDYPESALSYMKSGGAAGAMKYVNVGPYDTRSAESSYSLKEITPGSYTEAANLLYKASRDGWTPAAFHQRCDNKGATYTRAVFDDGRVLGAYTSLSWISQDKIQNDKTAFLYDGTTKFPSTNGHWGSGEYAVFSYANYYPTFGGGHDFYISGKTLYTNAYTFVSSNREAPFTMKVQMANMYGPWVNRETPTQIKFLNDGRPVYCIENDGYTKMATIDGDEKYYSGKLNQFNPDSWNNYSTTGGGKYLLNKINQFNNFPRRGWGSSQTYQLNDIEVYSVDANSFPNTNPPDYIRRVRTMPVGESINASMEKCQAMCDGDEKCGGFVYSKGGGGADGKCELKDKTKMYPVGLRVSDPTKQLMLKVPAINGTIADSECAKSGNGQYKVIDSTHYQYYPDGGAMSSGTKCNLADMVPKQGNLTMPETDAAAAAVSSQFATTDAKIAAYGAQTNVPGVTNEPFITLREGLETDISGSTYGTAMAGVSDTLKKIGNATYQRERLDAIKDESNKMLISESYKFILWSILAILAVMALLKIKEMFGQDDPDDAGGDAGAGACGILGFITSLFGMKAVNLDDIADKTGDVKAALANAGTTLQQSGENLATGITEGADNLVNSVNDAATNAMDGARNMAGQVSEKAAEAVNSIGETVSGPGDAQNNVTTGGRRRIAKHHK